MVAATIASAGVIRIWVQASERIICMFKTGELPGLKSVASATGTPASMRRRAGRIKRQTQMIDGSGEKHGDGSALGQKLYLLVLDLIQVVDGDGAHADSQEGGAAVRKLVGVQSKFQAVLLGCLEKSFGGGKVENIGLDKAVAIFREVAARYFGEHRVNEFVEVDVRSRAVFGRDFMGAEEGRDKFERGQILLAYGLPPAFSVRIQDSGRSRFWPPTWLSRVLKKSGGGEGFFG